MKTKKLIKILGLGSLSVFAIPFVHAQDEEEDLQELETLSFTGTRLTGAEVEGSLPILTFTEEEINLSPASTAIEFLRDLPIVGGPSTQSSNFTNGTDGAARVGLRTISGGNTLILLNGRRLTPSGTGATPDLNQIPLSAVKQIDILKAGGSVVYGTSAVAGVINFILDDEFEGFEASVGYGTAEDGQVASESTANFIYGDRLMDGKLRFTIGGVYRKEDNMMATDRPWMLGGGTSATPNPGSFFFYDNARQAIIDANGYTEAELEGITRWTLKPGVTVASGPEDFMPWINLDPYETDDLGRPGNRFPFENFTIAINPNKQYSVFGTLDYDLSENWSVFYEGGYAYSELEFRLAPAPWGFWIPQENYWMREIFGADITDADATLDGFGDAAYVAYRLLELGPRINENERHSIRSVVGVNGSIADWNVEAYFLYSDETFYSRELNGGSVAQTEELLELGTPDAYNLFSASWIYGTTLGGGSFNPEDPNGALGDLIRADSETYTFSKTQLTDVRVSNGDLFELPAGPVEVVFGAEWRKQYANEQPDALKLSGSLGWNSADGITEGDREVYGFYGEFGVPILENLDISFSGRYEDYKDEFTTDVLGVNLRYQPIRDLTFRASWSEAFVAPDLIDLYNPGFGSFPELNDPYFAADDPNRLYQVETQYVGSVVTGVPLRPETADVYSVGFTYSPSFIAGLDITVDWYLIDKVDLIGYSVQGFLNEFRDSYPGGNDGSETDPPADSPYLVENGGLITYDFNDESEPIQLISGAGPRNISGERLEGLDVQVSYQFETDTMGTFQIESDTAFIFSWEQLSSAGVWNDFIGEYDGDVAYPEIRSSLALRWFFGDWTFSGAWNWTSSTVDINVDPENNPDAKTDVEAHNEIDFQVSYVLPFFKTDLRQTRLTIGVENAFDELPPLMTTASSNNYPERNYDPRGRFWYVRLEQSF